MLRETLEEGSYRADRRMPWDAFITGHVAIIPGHKSLAATMTYYLEVSNAELNRLILKAAAAG